MLLGFIISERTIEANLEKVAPITKMGPIQNIKVGPASHRAPCGTTISSRTLANEAFPFTGS
jgi:hypothetical protein